MFVYTATLLAVVFFVLLRPSHNQKRNRKKSVRGAYVRALREFLGQVAIVGVAFSVLQVIVWFFPSGSDTLILTLERTVIVLRTLTKLLKLPEWLKVAAFMGLFLAGALSVQIASWKLAGRFSKSMKIVSKANVVLTLASSLSFFGTGTSAVLASTTAMLLQQIEDTRRGFARAEHAVENVIINAAVHEAITAPHASATVLPLSRAMIGAREGIERVEHLNRIVPRYEEYKRNPAAFPEAPQTYRLEADFSALSERVWAQQTNQNAQPNVIVKDSSVQLNSQLERAAQAENSKPKADLEVALEEAVAAAYEGSTDEILSRLRGALPNEIPAKLTEILIKKLATGPLKQVIGERIASVLVNVYKSRMKPEDAIAAEKAELVRVLHSGGESDLVEEIGNLREDAVRVERQVEEAQSTVESETVAFARAEAVKVFNEAYAIAERATISPLTDIQRAWQRVYSSRRNLGSDSYADLELARQLHAAAIDVRDGDAEKKSEAAIQFEILNSHTSSLQDAFRMEEQRILVLESTSHWGQERHLTANAVSRNTMNYTVENRRKALAAILGWEAFRDAQAKIAVRSGVSSQVQAEQWDKWFANYLLAHADMAALWGYIVISVEPSRVFDPYLEEELRHQMRGLGSKVWRPEHKNGSQEIDLSHLLNGGGTNHNYPNVESKKASEDLRIYLKQKIWEHGPYPIHGYRYFMKQMGIQTDAEASAYFRTQPVSIYVERFCPQTQ